MSLNRPVKILPPEVARKIAAGEVIDRPNAIVRELMDNAIDSKADSITVEIYGGGIDKIRVIDNGSGMSKDDLEIASTPHATSKIATEQDLLNLDTLGFRGEALSSIAAVSNLSIISGEYKLETSVIEKNKITPCQPVSGTIVQSENLFQNFPARRLFLKRAGTESKMCQTTFIEKALPFYNIDFRLYIDGELKIDLPKEKSLKDRFTTAYNYSAKKDLFYTISNSHPENNWDFSLIIGEPSIYRNDRKEINIYVNNRKIIEYSLLQAIEYGCQGFFPNGTHPVATIFITIKPELVDFNIHPAKKEVRFKDNSELHHNICVSTQNFFKDSTIKNIVKNNNPNQYENTFSKEFFDSPLSEPKSTYSSFYSFDDTNNTFQTEKSSIKQNYSEKSTSDMRSLFMNKNSYEYANHLAELATENDFEAKHNSISQSNIKSSDKIYSFDNNHLTNCDSAKTIETLENSPVNLNITSKDGKLKYYGIVLGVFLLVEKDNILYFIDQHAAHERILYNKIMNSANKSQKLLIPYEIETQSAQDDSYLESIQEQLEQAGFVLKNCKNGKWKITEIQDRWTGSEQELIKLILDDKVSPDKIISHIAASTACKAAIKDGYYLDSQTALDLAESALNLPDPHCPHGRPIWTTISKEQLFLMVRRSE